MILCDLPCSNSEIHSCFGKFACKRLVLVLTRAGKNRRSVCCHADSHEPERKYTSHEVTHWDMDLSLRRTLEVATDQVEASMLF